ADGLVTFPDQRQHVAPQIGQSCAPLGAQSCRAIERGLHATLVIVTLGAEPTVRCPLGDGGAFAHGFIDSSSRRTVTYFLDDHTTRLDGMPRTFALLPLALAGALLMGAAARAAGDASPSIAVTIKPLHSLVAAVMAGIGKP